MSTPTKLIAVLYGEAPDLHHADLRDLLRATGCGSVQVNVDDDDVVQGMRFGPGDGAGRAIAAFVTVWTTDPDRALSVLTGLGEDTHVYRVTERRPVEPPAWEDGVRVDALANIAVLRRPEGMTQEEYLEIWIGSHTAIASETQHTFGYIQNIVEEALTDGAPEISAIVEELFLMEGMTDPHAFYGSGGDDEELNRRITKLMTSVARFGADQGLDLVPTSRYLWNLP